jgi:2-oxoglutarate dehydrogenase E2 component (dihydrolipoamide succinyltransferase)
MSDSSSSTEGAREEAHNDAVEVVRLSSIRKKIGKHMRASRTEAAHTLMAMEVDYAAVKAARDIAKAEGRPLSYLPFISLAVASGIRAFPHVNATVDEKELHVFTGLNLGIAVDLDFQGLIVPVVHRADALDLFALAAEIEDLAERARNKKLKPENVADGTFTITNAGGFGTLFTGAIINQPQVAILSTDGITPKPVAIARDDGDSHNISDANPDRNSDPDYDVVVHPIGVLALSWDHRAFDGAYAAAFLQHLKTELEQRDWLSELNRRSS